MKSHSLLIYDDHCGFCDTLSSIVQSISLGRIIRVGHYTEAGTAIRRHIFQPEDHAEEMFWLIKDRAYGGRDAILPTIREVIGL